MKTLLIGASALALSATAALAEYPERAIEVTIPAPAGGGTDTSARKLATLLEEELGTSIAILNVAGGGGSVGVLVDQKFRKGVKTTFFGLPVKTNPLLPKLARQYGAEVYPARCIRLANGRYRLELQPRLDLPRDDNGEIAIEASCQALNDVVEGWVREHPDQWMWFHDRWQIAGKRKKGKR